MFRTHRNVVLSPKGSYKPAKSFDVTYIPLGDLASQKFQRSSISQNYLVKMMLWGLAFLLTGNPAYHCLYFEDRGYVSDDKLLYLKQVGKSVRVKAKSIYLSQIVKISNHRHGLMCPFELCHIQPNLIFIGKYIYFMCIYAYKSQTGLAD